MYKTVLCKYGLTASKIRVMGIRAMENRVRRGMTVTIARIVYTKRSVVYEKNK